MLGRESYRSLEQMGEKGLWIEFGNHGGGLQHSPLSGAEKQTPIGGLGHDSGANLAWKDGKVHNAQNSRVPDAVWFNVKTMCEAGNIHVNFQ